MPLYLCTTSNRGHSHFSQHISDTPEVALQEHIASLPFFEGINPIGSELYWLQNIALGKTSITLQRVADDNQKWSWAEGEQYSPPYTTFIEVSSD